MITRYCSTGLSIQVVKRTDLLPFKSTNPETTGWVHWIFDGLSNTLFVSEHAFESLRKLPDGQKDDLLLAMGASL